MNFIILIIIDCFDCDPVKVDDGKNSSIQCPISFQTKNFLNLANMVQNCIILNTTESCNRCKSDYKMLEMNFTSLRNACFDVENAVNIKNIFFCFAHFCLIVLVQLINKI